MSDGSRALDHPRVIGFAVLIGSLLLLYWLVMPVVVGSLADTRGLRDDQLGILASVYSAGIFIATFASITWIRRINWQTLLRVGSAGAAGGFLLIGFAPDFPTLIAGHALASLFTGVAYAVIMALLGDSLSPARNYALVFFVQVVLGVAASMILSTFTTSAQVLPLAAGVMVLLAVACLLLAGKLPGKGTKDGKPPSGSRQLLPTLPLAVGLVAIVLVFTGDSGIWVFLERIGAEGNGRAFGGMLVSVNLAAGAAGSLTAAWVAERWGYLWPMVAAIVLSLVSLGLFLLEDHPPALVTAAFINGWAWNFGSAYRMALVATLDKSGRFTVLIPSMQTLGNTIGPALTGFLLLQGGLASAFSAIAALWSAALLCYFYAWRSYRDDTHDRIS